MCQTCQPAAFLTLTIILTIALFVLTLLNMIFSLNYPYGKSFAEPSNLTNYDNFTSQSFLSELEFNESYTDQGMSYGLTGVNKIRCFEGYCRSSMIVNINCSEACLYSQDSCNENGKECEAWCRETIWKSDKTRCAEFNKVYSWKGYQSNYLFSYYNFSVLNDTVPLGENCHNGYKQCGYLNLKKDKLCIKSYRDCPINKIVVKNITEDPPSDYDYEKVLLSDKYIYYTNQNVDNYLYEGLFADSNINDYYDNNEVYNEIIDTDSIYNFLKYNPFLYDGKYSNKAEKELSKIGKAYLRLGKKNFKSLEEFKKLQEIYIRHKTLYTDKILNEMNSNASNKQDILSVFGIVAFAYFGGVNFYFIPLYSSVADCGKKCSCCRLTPLKSMILFSFVFSPSIISILISFGIVSVQKIIFNSYLNKDYINEYFYCSTEYYSREIHCNFEDIQFYNQGQFICLLLSIIIMITYVILMYLIYSDKKYGKESINDVPMIRLNDKPPAETPNINNNDSQCSADFAGLNYGVNNAQPTYYYQPAIVQNNQGIRGVNQAPQYQPYPTGVDNYIPSTNNPIYQKPD